MRLISERNLKLVLALLSIGACLWNAPMALAVSTLQVDVDVIKADKDSNSVDPRLQDLVKELRPVLNYSAFELLRTVELNLHANQKEQVILSTHQVLQLEFLGLDQDKARLSVVILEDRQEMFRTILLLVNKGTVMIGGPPHIGGVLLLRISGQFER